MSPQNRVKRKENEKKFSSWDELPGGGRRYYYVVNGHYEWTARYVKEVNEDEQTLSFFQEIYDSKGQHN